MGLSVSLGSPCQCTMGTAPCPIQPSKAPTIQSKGHVMATIQDTKAALATFGMCTSPSNPAVAAALMAPQPCSPVLPAPWAPGSPTITLNGIPGLTNDSKTPCAHGGQISVVSSTSPTVSLKG
jgi:hypothetical protein